MDYSKFFENLVNLRMGRKEMLKIKLKQKKSKNIKILENKKFQMEIPDKIP